MRALVLLALLAPAAVHAQDAPGEAKIRTSAVAAPDAVRLQNGGLLRGTISELVPGDYVVLITATGDVRRFPMSEVVYAGPAAGLAAPPAPDAPPGAAGTGRGAAPPSDGRIRIGVRSTQPQVTLHQRIAAEVSRGAAMSFGVGFGGGGFGVGAGSGVGVTPYASSGATYMPLCLAPCELSMTPGTYYFGLSLDDGLPVGDNRPLVVASESTKIVADYTSHEELRVAGWLVGAASFLGGGALLTWAVVTGSQQCNDQGGTCVLPDDRVAPAGAAVGIMIGGAIIAYVLGSFEDEVELTVE